MDTVSMLNTMSFYCQPILPLVYDESMSYYETLCKVVGQLNNTGETVNKLNEGLTAEIADRQAGDAALDARIKQIEALNDKIHFLVFDGANPSSAMPTRGELYNWVKNGDTICTLFSTNEAGRGQVYAVSCSYNAGDWGSEASNDFNLIVPIETKYDSANDYAIKQKVAKLTIPPISQSSLSVPWGLQIIEINTPYTSAEGVVNVIAVVSDSGSVNCSITPSEFLQLYNMTRAGKNLCVAVNAKLVYDGLARSSSVATVDTTNRLVRIAFERDYGTFTTNGVNQLNKTLDYIIGDAKTGTWIHETIDSKIFDFIRYEGFQFTRGANNVITTNDESTPNAVYAQYHSDTSGKLYQNLPTRLIDSVDGAEYWNGTFDIYGGNHMTFTFVTSNYATASDKMLVRVIELSADVGTTAWKYGVKEFTLPLSGAGAVTYVDFWPTGSAEEYSKDLKAWTISLSTNQTFDAIFDLISSGADVVARLYKDSTKAELVAKSVEAQLSGDKTLGNINFLFVHAANDVFLGFPTIADAIWVTKTASSTSTYALYKWCALPVPAGDSTDNGKVPTVNGTKWEMKTPPGGSSGAVLYTPQTLTAPQQFQARKNIDALGSVSPNIKNYMVITPLNEADGIGVSLEARGTGGNFTLDISDANEGQPTKLMGVETPIDAETHAAANVEYVKNKIDNIPVVAVDAALSGTSTHPVQNKVINDALNKKANSANPTIQDTATITKQGTGISVTIAADEFDPSGLVECAMSATGNGLVIGGLTTLEDPESLGREDIAVNYEMMKNYVLAHAAKAPIAIKMGAGNAATSTATFAEIKAALEAGNAPILDSGPGTSHWFALNWVLSGSGSLTIQYGTFEIGGGRVPNFSIIDVSVSSSSITYVTRNFSTE